MSPEEKQRLAKLESDLLDTDKDEPEEELWTPATWPLSISAHGKELFVDGGVGANGHAGN